MSSQAKAHDGIALACLVVPLAAALASAGMLVVDYLRPSPLFCAVGAGCQALRESAFSHVLGIPLPILGSFGFAVLALLALSSGERARRLFLAAAGLASVVAVALIGVQFALHTFCKFCLVVDGSALLLLAVAIVRFQKGWDPPKSLGRTMAGGALGLAATVPLLIGAMTPPSAPVPDIDRPAETPLSIQAEIMRTPKGLVTFVDFVDFECPHCRRMHHVLKGFLAEHGKQVRLVRKQKPIEELHPHAHDAARGALCGDKLGKGDLLAEKLFEAPEEDLTPAGIGALAAEAGIDRAAFDACVADPATDQAIQIDKMDFQIAGGRGLPLLWIDGERLLGARPRESLDAAFERALAGSGAAASR